MGKKKRTKRKRKAARGRGCFGMLPQEILPLLQNGRKWGMGKNEFSDNVTHTRALIQQYNVFDVALAICVSDIWPENVASSIKHILAWMVLLESGTESHGGLQISTYEEFSAFLTSLYSVLPDMPMLEDFSPEADWGQTRVRLASDFVPIFYGSCIERTPDFIESFRITYAGIKDALSDMDYAIAVQSYLINSMSELFTGPMPKPESGYVEVPPKEFWLACRSALQQVSESVASWRSSSAGKLEIAFGVRKYPLTSSAFHEAVMQGQALPYTAISHDGRWIPLSVRSLPAVVVDYWARQNLDCTGAVFHGAIASFVKERFRNVYDGPLTLLVEGVPIVGLHVSCVIVASSGLYLICGCDHLAYGAASKAARAIYTALQKGQRLYFKRWEGGVFCLGRNGRQGPTVDELHIIFVLSQSTTSAKMINTPERPARLLALADFVTIVDALDDVDELGRFWKYVDEQGEIFPLSRAPVDMFASYKDCHGVLVDGADTPSMVMLYPHWGTEWRFNELSSYWSQCPHKFPDSSGRWLVGAGTEGVTRLEARHRLAFGFSTHLGGCIVQAMAVLPASMARSDFQMLEMFSELLVDRLWRSRDVLSGLLLFQQPHVVFICEVDTYNAIDINQISVTTAKDEKVITYASLSDKRLDKIVLKINSKAVLDGLTDAIDASFEISCTAEVLQSCYDLYGLALPDGVLGRLKMQSTELARFHLQIAERYIDVPDYVDPIMPSPTDYKLARKHLAIAMQEIGLVPGRYELAEAKAKIDAGRSSLLEYIEQRFALFDKMQLIRLCIEQHDAALAAERNKIEKLRQSLSHSVEYDRLEAAEEARKELGSAARHYRYILEKVLSSTTNGDASVTNEDLRELVGLVDWYKVLADASDVLHNDVDVGGIEIDDSFVPDVFYSADANARNEEFARKYAGLRLGVGVKKDDEVIGAPDELFVDENVRQAFIQDMGFELRHLIYALGILSQPNRWGLAESLALSYSASATHIARVFAENVEGLTLVDAMAIVEFLTLSAAGILTLAGKTVKEKEVPYWEHKKRVHRYAIRPLIGSEVGLIWGAETVSRAMHIWTSSVRDGYLPADFPWPQVTSVIRKVKEGIEKGLEKRTEEIFLRYTPYVARGVDFYRRYRGDGFDDVGDFDAIAYWPDMNLLVVAECKYNQPSFSIKDSRRLRDRIFGKSEGDRNGQFSKIMRRRQLVAANRERVIDLLEWPAPYNCYEQYRELYVGRDMHYWHVNPPYSIPTEFVRVDMLDAWLKKLLAL